MASAGFRIFVVAFFGFAGMSLILPLLALLLAGCERRVWSSDGGAYSDYNGGELDRIENGRTITSWGTTVRSVRAGG